MENHEWNSKERWCCDLALEKIFLRRFLLALKLNDSFQDFSAAVDLF